MATLKSASTRPLQSLSGPTGYQGSVGRVVLSVVLPLAILLAWYLASTRNVFGPGLLPTPADVVSAFAKWMFGTSKGLVDPFSGTWLASVVASTQRVLIGFATASLAGVVLGLLIGRSSAMELVFDPTFQALRPIPVTAWVPFTLVFFGISPSAAISLIVVAAFFPVLVNSTSGAHHVPDNLLRAARMLGASETYIMRRVVLPWSLPMIFTGLRLGIGMSWVAVIVSEMIGVKSGLGYILWQSYYWSRTDLLLATVITIGALGFISDRIIYRYARRRFFWVAR